MLNGRDRRIPKAIGLVLSLGLMCSPCVAQPVEGDLVISMWSNSLSVSPSFVGYLSPSGPARVSTLVIPQGSLVNAMRMAEDNTDLVVAGGLIATPPAPSFGFLGSLDPWGNITTLGVIPGTTPADVPRSFALEPDGWIVHGADGANTRCWILTSNMVTTLFNAAAPSTTMAAIIDRDPGAHPYVLLLQGARATRPWLLGATRSGVITTLATQPFDLISRDLALDPATGSYLVCGLRSGSTNDVIRVSKSGVASPVPAAVNNPSCIRIAQDGTWWVGTYSSQGIPEIYRVARDRTTVSVLPLPTYANVASIGDIEIYGSRRLTCSGSGRPGTSVLVRLCSQRPSDPGRRYVLGCSVARRPGMVMPNGEHLNLAVDPLLALSATGSAPAIFQSFRGTVGPTGRATAWIHVPSSVPRGLGQTIFVGGIIYDGTGVQAVTNTHWFTLS